MMRAIIQRVGYANITIEQKTRRSISGGLVVFLGIENGDSREDIRWLTGKIAKMRIFSDHEGKMNLSVTETGGEIMVVSQFTLHASTKKGNRPSWIRSATPDIAKPLYSYFVDELQKMVRTPLVTGEFGAHMDVELLNDGPVTIFLDTKNKE